MTELQLPIHSHWRVADGEARGRAVARFLHVSGSLTNLNLHYNEFGDEGAKALAAGLAVNGSLTSLNLEYNDIGNKGWCAIFDALRDNPQNKITKWDLAAQGINPTIAKSLAAYVAVSGSRRC